MAEWTEVKIYGTGLSPELIGQPLQEIRARGFIPEKDLLKVFFDQSSPETLNELAIRNVLQPFIDQGLVKITRIEINTAENEDWIARWRRSLGPVRAGEHFVIVPPGIEFEQRPDDIVLNIEPKMAFGTGEHPTTTMALQLLEPVVTSSSQVLDIGCGNGVLSLASLLLGAEYVFALDNELEAVTETTENISLHNFTGKTEVVLGDALNFQIDRKFNIVLANILFRPIMAGLKKWTELTLPQSHIILTGIQFGEECNKVNRYAQQMGLNLDFSIHDENWYAARYTLK